MHAQRIVRPSAPAPPLADGDIIGKMGFGALADRISRTRQQEFDE